MVYFKNLIRFVGHKSGVLILVGIIASIGISFVELMVSIFIQAFLVCLGFITQKISLFGIQLPSLGINQVIFFLIIIGLLRFFMQTVTTQSAVYINEVLNARLRCICIFELFSKSLTNCNDVSEINFKMTEIFPKASLFICNLAQFFSFLFQGASLLLIMFLTLWKESLVSMSGIFIISLLILFVNKKIRKIAVLIPKQYNKLSAGIERVFKNIIFLNVMRIKSNEYKNMVENIINYGFKAIRINFLNSFVSTLAPFLGIVLLVVIILFSHNVWHTSPILLLSFLYLLIRFIQNLSSLSSNFGLLGLYWPQLKVGLNYYNTFSSERLKNLFKPANELNFMGCNEDYQLSYNLLDIENSTTKNKLEKINSKQPEIIFDQVSFRYPNSELNILDQFCFQVKPGTQFGIVGTSGVGKTTILMLILGLLEPICGKIQIESKSPKEYFDDPNIRVGYVGVEPFLIKGSIRDNLLYGIKFKVSEEEIWDSLKLVNLNSFVESVGLNYHLPEDQSGLSAGQKQRICLARAFLNKPTLLILDEATANLDEQTESEVALSVNSLKGKCTTVIVSHRQGIIKYVDNLLELKKL